MTPEYGARFGTQAPIRQPAQPEELVPAYVFLASNADSSYITGTVLQMLPAKRPEVNASPQHCPPLPERDKLHASMRGGTRAQGELGR